MPKVTLAKSIRLPGDRLRRVGEVVEVSEDVLSRYSSMGVFVRDIDRPSPKPVEARPDEREPAEDPKAKQPKRPPRTAPVESWRAYAEAQGIDPKGLSKSEIIAATN